MHNLRLYEPIRDRRDNHPRQDRSLGECLQVGTGLVNHCEPRRDHHYDAISKAVQVSLRRHDSLRYRDLV